MNLTVTPIKTNRGLIMDFEVNNPIGANLIGTSFIGANLRKSCFVGANLSRAYFVGSNISGADFSGANLIGANLIGANLSCAALIGASLRGTDLSRATWDSDTQWPEGIGPLKTDANDLQPTEN